LTMEKKFGSAGSAAKSLMRKLQASGSRKINGTTCFQVKSQLKPGAIKRR
jgi:hypothetical protein